MSPVAHGDPGGVSPGGVRREVVLGTRAAAVGTWDASLTAPPPRALTFSGRVP
jgi:hypothetical protein